MKPWSKTNLGSGLSALPLYQSLPATSCAGSPLGHWGSVGAEGGPWRGVWLVSFHLCVASRPGMMEESTFVGADMTILQMDTPAVRLQGAAPEAGEAVL